MSLYKSIQLPLDQILVYRQDNFLEYCNSEFGDSLGKILYEYTNEPSIDIFNQNKSILLDGYVEYNNNKLTQRNLFFYRFEKIIRLLEYWLEHRKWRDPVVVIQPAPMFYYAHPGKDRVLIMKSLGVKEYNFFEFDKDQLTEDNLQEIKKLWGNFSSNVTLEYAHIINQNIILNKDNVDEILKFQKTKQWLRSDKSLEVFLTNEKGP